MITVFNNTTVTGTHIFVRPDADPVNPADGGAFGVYLGEDFHGNATEEEAREAFEKKRHFGRAYLVEVVEHGDYCFRLIDSPTNPGGCKWDSYIAGCIWLTDECPDEHGDEAKALLTSFLEDFEAYTNGACYEWVHEEDGEHVDSCGGYYSEEEAIAAAELTADASG